MVRGLLSGLVQEFPYVQFPRITMTGDLLFDPLWKAIACIERCGLKVLAVTADGASPNHRLFKIHNPFSSDTSHKIKNPYSTNGRDLFFLSDQPHLLKTTRNCFARKSRTLWVSSHITTFSSLGCSYLCTQCKGKEISWSHTVRLYYHNNGEHTNMPGVPRLVHKLKYEHINLTSFSKMTVDLAAQVWV